MGMKLNRCPKVSASTGIRVIPPEETLKKVIPLLEKAGMDPLEDITDRDNLGIPVYSVYRKKTAKGTFGNYNGKGATPEQAKASAVMEAMERYSAEQRESDEVAYGTLEQMRESGMPFAEPADLILPARVLGMVESAEIAWTVCYDIMRGEDVWVPACAVFYPYYPDGDLQLFRFHTNGIASGNINGMKVPVMAEDEEEAVRAALQTCVGTDMNDPKIVRIKDTLHLSEIEVSENMLSLCADESEFVIK